MRVYIWLFIFFSLASCSQPSDRGTKGDVGVDTIRWSQIQAFDALEWEEVVERVEFIKLQTLPTCLIGEISKIVFESDRIFIFDELSQGIFVFDREGVFINSIGNKGRGPGEYVRFETGYVDPLKKRVVVFDAGSGKVLKYALDGTPEGAVKVDNMLLLSSGVMMEDGDVLCDKMLYNDISKHLYTLLDGSSFQIKSSFLDHSLKTKGYMAFFANHPISASHETLLIAPFSNVVYKYIDGAVVPRYYVETGNDVKDVYAFPDPIRSDYLSIRNELRKTRLFCGFNSIFETDQYLMLGSLDGTLLWDKINRTGLFYGMTIRKKDTPLTAPSVIAIGTHNDAFVGYWSAGNIMNTKRIFSDTDGSMSDQVKQIVDATREDDNPVLVLTHLKPQIGTLEKHSIRVISENP